MFLLSLPFTTVFGHQRSKLHDKHLGMLGARWTEWRKSILTLFPPEVYFTRSLQGWWHPLSSVCAAHLCARIKAQPAMPLGDAGPVTLASVQAHTRSASTAGALAGARGHQDWAGVLGETLLGAFPVQVQAVAGN